MHDIAYVGHALVMGRCWRPLGTWSVTQNDLGAVHISGRVHVNLTHGILIAQQLCYYYAKDVVKSDKLAGTDKTKPGELHWYFEWNIVIFY